MNKEIIIRKCLLYDKMNFVKCDFAKNLFYLNDAILSALFNSGCSVNAIERGDLTNSSNITEKITGQACSKQAYCEYQDKNSKIVFVFEHRELEQKKQKGNVK